MSRYRRKLPRPSDDSSGTCMSTFVSDLPGQLFGGVDGLTRQFASCRVLESQATFRQANDVVRLLTALGVCVSGRRGAERSERCEDGTPAARDPSEARGTPSGPYQLPEKLIPS
jgi:hypothetical protein